MAGTISARAQDYFEELAAAGRQVDVAAVHAYADALFEAWKHRRRVFVFGNGGSAFNASHHVCDYVKTASVEGAPRLHATSLSDNMGLTTAIGNDLDYDDIFRFPLESYAQAGDLAVAISCSGNSPNVLRACEWAREHGLTVVALTACSGGQLAKLGHVHIHVPTDNYGVAEDIHMSVGHIAAQMLKVRVGAEIAAKPAPDVAHVAPASPVAAAR